MEGPNPTASTIVHFAQRLEDDASKFYGRLANAFGESRETFLAFAKESERSRGLISRTYQETVSDAIETGFSFEGLDLNVYAIEVTLEEDLSYPDALQAAMRLEEKAVSFYRDVAERSQSLLATIPRAFRKVAEMRSCRREKLSALLNSLKP